MPISRFPIIEKGVMVLIRPPRGLVDDAPASIMHPIMGMAKYIDDIELRAHKTVDTFTN